MMLVLENIRFDTDNNPYCPKCNAPLKKLLHSVTTKDSRGTLFYLRCAACGRVLLARDDGKGYRG